MELTTIQSGTLRSLLDPGEGTAHPDGLAVDLRSRIEAGIAQALPLPSPPMRVWKERLNNLSRCEGLFAADVAGELPAFEHGEASAAGTLAHRAVELEVALEEQLPAPAIVEHAADRLSTDRRFGPYWAALDEVLRAELRMQAVRSLEQFRASFPPMRDFRRRLAPVTELWLDAWFGGGAVLVRGKVDLLLNAAGAGRRSRRVIVDLKGGRPRSEHHEDMRLYALLFTLRTGLPPFRVATFFLSSGQWQPEDVTRATLERAADRIVGAVVAAAELSRGSRVPILEPGVHCRSCPRRTDCPAAASGGADPV